MSAELRPGLWHLHSKVLAGFYQSDIYVVAYSHHEASTLATKAYKKWCREYHEDMGYIPGVDYFYGDDDLEEKLTIAEKRFAAEVAASIQRLPETYTVCYST